MIAASVVVPGRSFAQLPSSELHWLSQQATQLGESFELTVHGTRLEELSGLIVTDLQGAELPVEVEPRFSPPQPLRDWVEATGTFQMKFNGEIQPGLIEIRTTGRLGASNSRTFLLSRSPVEIPGRDHSSLLTAYSPRSGSLVNDQTVALQSKFFRYSLPAGQCFQCAAYCKQLDSLAELSVRLLDQNGHELVSSRTLGAWPAEVSWQNRSELSMELYIEVKDLLGRGGPQYSYLLECSYDECGAIQRQAESSATLNDNRSKRDYDTDSDWRVGDTSTGFLRPTLHLDDLLRPTLRNSVRPEQFLQPMSASFDFERAGERVDAARGQQSTEPIAEFPASIFGDLKKSFSVDFIAQPEQSLTFDVSSSKLYQLTDPTLVLFSLDIVGDEQTEQLQFLGHSDDAAYCGTPAVRLRQTDPHWVWTAPKEGTYRLQIADNQSGARPSDSCDFLLEIRQTDPRFSLIAYRAFPSNDAATSIPFGTNLMRLGTERIHVTVIRQDGFGGAIELAVNGLPDGCQCHPVIVSPGATEATLVIQASEEINDQHAMIDVIGTARLGEHSIEVRAAPVIITAGASAIYNTVSARRSGVLDLALVKEDTAPLQLQLGDGNVIEAKPDSKVAVPLKLLRNEGGNAECTLRPQDLPPKVSIAEVKIPAGQNDATLELVVASDAPEGEFTFWGLVETKVKWRVNPQALSREQEYLAQLQSALETKLAGSPEAADPLNAEGSQTDNQDETDSVLPVSKEQLEAAIASTTARIEQLTKQSAEQEHTLWLPTNSVRVRVSQ